MLHFITQQKINYSCKRKEKGICFFFKFCVKNGGAEPTIQLINNVCFVFRYFSFPFVIHDLVSSPFQLIHRGKSFSFKFAKAMTV